MQHVSCPSCGALVRFQSTASVMAVCEYCKTTVLKDADAVKDLGRMANVLEDYSPIQIGTSGRYRGAEFTVVGRIQLRYDAGLWNEWFVLFTDSRIGWLSDGSGQFTLTFEQAVEEPLPAFSEVRAGDTVKLLGLPFSTAESRVAQCTGGQGELPFRVGAGWKATLADFRYGRRFVTLDYSDTDAGAAIDFRAAAPVAVRGTAPVAYVGEAVTLAQLECQLLRDDDTIRDSAGKIDSKVQPLDCPSCGSSLRYVPGITREIVCSSCRAHVSTTTKVAIVLDAGDRMAKADTTLALGANATIAGARFEAIGVMVRAADGTQWTEYLLYSPRRGFLWLIETDDGWQRADVLEDWPHWDSLEDGQLVIFNKQDYRRESDYVAGVAFAAGAFNWTVRAGDTARVIEFKCGQQILAAEVTSEEMTWSRASPVSADQLRAWFGDAIKAERLSTPTDILTIARYAIYGTLACNVVPLIFAFDDVWLYAAFAAAAIYLPAWGINLLDKDAA